MNAPIRYKGNTPTSHNTEQTMFSKSYNNVVLRLIVNQY